MKFGSIALWCLLAVAPSSTFSDEFPTTTVFTAGAEGYRIYRIPTVIRTRNGNLLAFCEAREGGDASKIDLVMKRSTDNGQTWGKIQIVQSADEFKNLFGENPPPITIGNPAPVVDLLDPIHSGRVWLPFTLENDRIFVVYSDDHGRSWSKRREITKDVKKPKWGWYATGPVHSIQLIHGKFKGRLVVPCDHRMGEAGRDAGLLGSHAIYSDDHGNSWQLGATDETYEDGLGANETTVVELNDGRLYFNTRDQNGRAPGTRGAAFSSDGGKSFDATEGAWKYYRPLQGVIDPPVVQCAVQRMTSELILFSGPDENGPTGKGRSDLRIRWSSDEAASWTDGPLIHEGPAAYSDMVLLSDGRLGVLFEAGDIGQKNAYQRIDFSIVTEEQIRNAAEH